MEFQRKDLVALLNKLTTRLNQLDIQGTFRIVGGAAISLQHVDREPTLDIDADFISTNDTKNEIKQVIEEIANSEGLSANWLNDFAMVFLPKQTNDDWIEFQQSGGIRIVVASAPLLLAMKMQAVRGDRDAADILALLELCRVSTVADAIAIYSRYYGNEVVKEKATTLIRKYFGEESI